MNEMPRTASLKGQDTFEDKAAFLSAMGNGKRLHILYLLSKREYSVSVLADEIGLSQSAASQHLALLRDQELVRTRRAAQMVYYSIQSQAVMTMLDTLTDVFGFMSPRAAVGSAG